MRSAADVECRAPDASSDHTAKAAPAPRREQRASSASANRWEVERGRCAAPVRSPRVSAVHSWVRGKSQCRGVHSGQPGTLTPRCSHNPIRHSTHGRAGPRERHRMGPPGGRDSAVRSHRGSSRQLAGRRTCVPPPWLGRRTPCSIAAPPREPALTSVGRVEWRCAGGPLVCIECAEARKVSTGVKPERSTPDATPARRSCGPRVYPRLRARVKIAQRSFCIGQGASDWFVLDTPRRDSTAVGACTWRLSDQMTARSGNSFLVDSYRTISPW